MYVDETGNADLAASVNPVHRFLSLTGLIVNLEQMRTVAIPEVQRIKAEILGFDPDDSIPLHRREIMQKAYPFHKLRDPATESAFNNAILNLLRRLPYIVVTVVIDKDAHLKRYKHWTADPYHYCMKILFERYCLILNSKGASGDAMSEARGKREDRRLREAYETLCSAPHPIRSDVVEKCITSKKLKILGKDRNIAGLQLADLIAHPSAMHARSEFNNEEQQAGFGAQIVQILRETKYHRHFFKGITGYGLKWLP